MEARNFVVDRLTNMIATIARIDPGSIDPDQNLIELGADSIILTDVNSFIREEFGVEIPLTMFFEQLTSVSEIADYIYPQLTAWSFSPSPASASNAADRVAVRQEEAAMMQSAVTGNSDMPEAASALPVTSPLLRLESAHPAASQLPRLESADTGITQLLVQQLEIMNNQLRLLSGNQAAAAAEPAVARTVAVETPRPGVAEEVKTASVLQPSLQQSPVRNGLEQTTSASAGTSDSQPYVPYKPLDLARKQADEQQKQHIEALMKSYTAKTKKSKAFAASYHLPYADWRNISGFRPAIKEMVYQLVFQYSQGAYITDIDGNQYIDLTMDFGASLFGHNVDFIKEAIQEEMTKGFPLSLITDLSGEVAKLICEMTGVERVSFFNSGTEAVMVAMRLARAATGKNKIVIFSGAYHGTFDGVLGMNMSKDQGGASPIAGGILQSYVDDLYVLNYDDPKSLTFIAEHAHEIAAVMAEPVQSRRPDLVPREFLQQVRALTEQRNMLLIFDEMILGFRLGKGGAQEFFGVEADLVTYGKIVGGGMPIGIVSGKQKVMDCLDGGVWQYGDDSVPPYEDKRTFAGGTFCHHPLAMAAAKAVLLKIKAEADTIYPQINRRTQYLAEELNRFFRENEVPAKIVYCGSLFRFVLKGNMEMFYYHLLDQGVYIWEGRNCFLSVSHTDEDIDRIIQVVQDVCLKMKGVFFARNTGGGNESNGSSIKKKQIELTLEQQRMLVSEMMNPGTSAFNQSILLHITGQLDHSALNAAAHKVISRHEALRCTFSSDRTKLMPHEEVEFEIATVPVHQDTEHEITAGLIRAPFDYDRGPLIRLYLLKDEQEPASRKLLITAHHFVADGWSLSVFCEELMEAYNSSLADIAPQFSEVVRYSDYLQQREAELAQLDTQEIVQFWRSQLADCDSELALPRHEIMAASDEGKGARLTYTTDDKWIVKVRKAAAAVKCSPFMVLLTAYQVMLSELTGQRQFAVGVPFAGQASVSPKALIGNCVTILPVTVQLGASSILSHLARKNQEQFKAFDAIRYFPIEAVTEPGDERLPKLNMMFNMDRMPQKKEFAGTTVEMLPVETDSSMYDLFFNVIEFNGSMVFDIDFNTGLYSRQTVHRWLELYLDIIDQFCHQPEMHLYDLQTFRPEDEDIAMEAMKQADLIQLQQDTGIRLADFIRTDEPVYGLIMNKESRPVLTNQYGVLYLGPSRAELYHTGWMARFTNESRLELLGPEKCCYVRDGKFISLWLIERALKACPDVLAATVYIHEATGELTADIHPAVEGLTANRWLDWCLKKMPVAMIPKRFYETNGEANAEKVLFEYHKEAVSEAEESVYEIIGDLVGLQAFGKHENLISLGMSSLQLIKLLSALQAKYNVRIPVTMLAKAPTVSGVAAAIDQLRGTGHDHMPLMPRAEAGLPYYKTSSAQKRMYVLHELQEDKLNYNMPSVVKIEGQFEIETFKAAVYACIQRHENLRTSFHELDGEIVQKIHETSFISIEVLDRTDVENEQQLMTFIKEQLVAPFQLDQPLMRACIIRYGEHAYMAFFDFHHIIFDGASAAVFAREVMALYHQAQLPPLSCQYKDYVLWLNSFQDSERMAAQENSWREWLPHRPQTDYVALDHLRPAIRTYAGQLVKLDLDPELKSMIDRLCREHGTTPYVFFLTALNVLLSMYSMEQEIVIGTLVEGRNHHEVHDLIGMFVNTLPIVTQVDQEQSFQAFMKGMQQRVLNVFASSDVPFERIVELSGRAIEQGRNPLFDILFSYQGFEPLQLQSGDTLFEYMELPTEDCKFDIEFEVVDQTSHYQLIVHYAAELYEPATIHRLIDHFMTLIASILSNADQPLSRLEMLTPDERSQILTEFNRSDTVFPDDQTVVTAFEEWVRQTPDQTAILFEQEKVTYRQFNAEANQLARFLLEQGMQEDNIAGIMLYRSPAMIQGIMGIWKAGGAYLPLDVEHPVRRRLEVLHEAGAKWVLTLSEYVEEEFRAGYEGTILCLDELAEHIGSYSQDNLEHKPSPAQLAYSLFTSGSTGKPKGVMIEHAGMLNHIWAERDLLGLGADMVFAQNANHCFDISVWQLTGALALGGTTAIYSNELVLEPQRFVDRMIEDGVTLLEVVPSYLTVMMDDAETREVKHPHLRHLIITGEAVKPHLLKRWFALYPDVPVVNAYGPAEASDDISQYVISRMPDAMETVPIGRPLNNVRIYILDPQGRLCPVGHVGEICVAGLCVGRGYVNQPEKTAQVFVEDPYALAEDIPRNKRMYRTGDLGKWLPDGNIEYLGRMDEQVKIRGYRIELGEIESVLRKQAGVRDAAVIAREDAQGDKYLCAYVVPQAAESAESFDREWSRNELRKELPDYMVPMYYVTLEQLPVTSNGKLDRRALPEPERSSEAAMTPRNETEEQLVKIFQDVLGLDQVGIHDSFFELGGHSLRAVRAINLMETVTGVRLPLRTMFEHPTVAAISELLIGGTAPESYAPIPQAEQKDTYPMSSAQKRLFVIHQMDAQSTVYNMAGVLQMDGEVDLVRMNEAFQQLVDRHESLRTSFHIVDGEPVQRIHERVHVEVEFEIEEADSETKWQPVAVATEADTQHGSWSEKDGAGGDASGSVTEISDRNAARADQHLAAFVRPFELSQAPLIRLKVVEAASGSHLLLFDMHHIISDGASINVVTREFLQLYNGETLAPLPVHYKDYSEWMRTQDLNESKAYWEHQFSGELPVLDLPLDYPRPQLQSFEGAVVRQHMDGGVREAVQRLSRETGATEFMVLLSGLMTLLGKYSRQEDIIVGSPVSGRLHHDTEGMVGMFVNTLALRGQPVSDKVYLDFLAELKDVCLKGFEHQAYPFEDLVEAVQVRRDMSRHPIFDVMFVLQNNEEEAMEAEGIQFGEVTAESRTAKFDVTMTVIPTATGYTVEWEYASRLFTAETIRRMSAHYKQLLQALVEGPQQRLGELEIVTAEEKALLLQGFHAAPASYPADQNIKSLFEEQVRKTPHRIAVAYEGEQLSYEELNARANVVAHHLLSYKTAGENIVGLLLERNINLVVGILGVVKAGCTYLPIDPEAPADRISYTLEDSQARLLLTNANRMSGEADGKANEPSETTNRKSETSDTCRESEATKTRVAFSGPTLTIEELLATMDGLDASSTGPFDLDNPDVEIAPEDALYIIYTSGTTGQPKGTVIEHRNVVRLMINDQMPFAFQEHDVWSMFHSYNFDFSVWEMYGALLYGGKVVVVPRAATKDSYAFLDLLRKERVTVLNQVPSAFYELMHAELMSEDERLSVQHLIFGGEALQVGKLKGWQAKYPEMNIVNMYGITETTVHVTHKTIREADIARGISNIGNAIPTLKLYILNGDQLCGIGMPGELCVAGAGVARGYLNRPELTAKKFVENPFEPGERMYRSGDLARWLPDGNIEYLGRMDDQVKIRGYRIELQEIEQVLLKQEAVQDAAVLARKDRAGDAYLCAYVVGKAEWTIEAGSLKESIRRDLPDYMVPAHIMVLEKLPVTNNGKLDRRSLPEPAQQERQAYVAPRNEQEQTLVQAFEQVLGVEPIGIDDNFFELGGDSIKAIRVISKLREAGYELGVKELMFERTPRNMAWKMEAVTAGLLKYSQEERTGEVQLTPIQKLFFGWKLARPHHYNQTMLLESKAPLNIDSLHAALKAVIKHHDMLRAIYPEEGRQYLLSSTESKGYDFSLFDLGSLEDEAQLAEVIETEGNRIQESIDLQAGPLLKVGLFRTIKGDQLLLCLHHLVVDGVSWRILLEDLETAYGQSERGEAIELPSKTASYQEWAEALQEYAGSEELARELSYWNEVRAIAEAQAMQHLKLTDAEPDYMTTTLKLDTDSTEQLLYEAGRMYNMEINDLLLSALSRSAREWKGQEGMMIELEGHGREIIHKPIDIDRTVGWFTSIFPVSLPYAEDLQQHLVAVKETLRKIPNRGMGYGVIQHLGRADWEPIRHEYCFNYLGQLDNESTEGRLLALSPFSAGESVARENAQAHPFTINASVLNKQLVLDITYDLNSYTPDQITHFKEIYRQAIADILAHCLAKDSTVQTASDFGELDLDMDEFNEIMRTYS